VEQTRILSEKIAPYVIESMNYKILDQHRFIKKIQLNTTVYEKEGKSKQQFSITSQGIHHVSSEFRKYVE
jgi:hypothetical protein